MKDETAGTTVHAQTVLYRNTTSDVWRFLRGLGASAKSARRAGLLRSLDLAVGDCSPTPVLGDADVKNIEAVASEIGLDGFKSTFFAANLGSAGGHNRLAVDNHDELLLIMNPDTYLAPNALRELLVAIAKPRVGVAEPRQIPFEHPKAFDPDTGDTSWASGCCILTRRSATFEAIGGVDADCFPLFCDDVDYSWRVRLSGQKVVHVPRAVVFHDKEPGEAGHIAPTQVEVYYGTYARLMLAVKYARPDIVDETIRHIEATKEHDQMRALAAYRDRLAAGTLPVPISGAEQVAEFTDGNYARHRF